VIRALNDAVVSHATVRIRYRTSRTGSIGNRNLDPYRVWYRSGGLYVVGYDHKSCEIRTFAVDRIRTIESTDEHFQLPPDFDFDGYIGSSFGVIAEPATTVRIRFDRRWANYVAERTWHASQTLAKKKDGGLLLTMQVGGVADLRTWVLSFGGGAEVLEPAALRREVIAELGSALERYRRKTGGRGVSYAEPTTGV
jgi:predicted DNA-binding transcriptional regulator YafY